jgi:hypothetical protein
MHLQNLFVVVGNAELSNEMVSCTVVQKVFIIKVFYSSSSVNLILQEEVCFIGEPCGIQGTCCFFKQSNMLCLLVVKR